MAAIDQAVADGVDVINFSISGTSTNFLDPVEIAFLFAADAGVFVAASAGNNGPTSSTVAHPSPWLTTVTAGTHNRDGQGSVTLGNGVTYFGASVAALLASKPLIDSTAAGLPGADPTALALCFTAEDNGGLAVLDPAKVAGKIVVCDRGVSARVDKSLAVQRPGGLGMLCSIPAPTRSTPIWTRHRPCICRTPTARRSKPMRQREEPRQPSMRRRWCSMRWRHSRRRSRRAARCAPEMMTC